MRWRIHGYLRTLIASVLIVGGCINAIAADPAIWCTMHLPPIVRNMYELEGSVPKDIRRMEEEVTVLERNQTNILRRISTTNIYEFDHADRLVAFKAGNAAKYSRVLYDEFGRVISDGETSVAYSGINSRLEHDLTMASVDLVIVTPTENLGWLIRTQTTSNPKIPESVGREIEDHYDSYCRLVTRTDSDIETERKISYSTNGDGSWQSKEITMLGDVTTLSTKEYDAKGRMIGTQQETIGKKIFRFQSKIQYSEDGRGNITRISATETAGVGGNQGLTTTTRDIVRTLDYW